MCNGNPILFDGLPLASAEKSHLNALKEGQYLISERLLINAKVRSTRFLLLIHSGSV